MPEWSPYTYTFNNPIYFTDPDGRSPVPGMGPIAPAVGAWLYRKAIWEAIKATGRAIMHRPAPPTTGTWAPPTSGMGAIPAPIDRNVTVAHDLDRVAGLSETFTAGEVGVLNETFDQGQAGVQSETFTGSAQGSFVLNATGVAESFDHAHGHTNERLEQNAIDSGLRNLSNEELLEAISNPANGEAGTVRVNERTNVIMNGNTRIYELKRRGMGDTEINYERYYDNNSEYFPDF